MNTLAPATLLTNFIGKPYQFFLNLSFGETMAEQHSHTADFESRYKFNSLSQLDKVGSKELQDELGLALKKNICYKKREKFNEIITYIYTSKSCIY